MAENLFDQSVESLNTDQTFEEMPQMETAPVDQQQVPGSGTQTLPANYLSQSSLYTDAKGKSLDTNPKARASAANHLIQNKLPEPSSFQQLVARNRAILDSDPLLQRGASSEGVYKESIVRRYDDQDYGFIPGIDNDDFYGKREAWYETAGKGLFRIPTYIVTKTLQGAGFLGGLVSPWNYGTDEGVISKAADNTLYKWMEGFDDYTKNEWMPTFQEAADREKGFWARVRSDGDFWAEDTVDGLAFMLSAFVPGMALSKVGLGAAALRGLGSVSRVGAASLGTSIEGAEAIANYFTQAQRAARGIDQFGTWALATASESMFEAKEVRDNVRNALRDKIKNDGSYYSDDEINKIAGESAKNTFLMNSVLLGATNVFQMKYFAKALGMGEKSVLKGGILGGEGLASQAALSPTESALKYYGKVLGGGIAREGFIEENMQLAIQRINERYGTQGKMSSMLEFDTYSDLLNQYSTQTSAAIRGEDKEASMNIGLGGLLGGGSNVILSRGERESKRLTAEAALNGYNTAQENWLKFGNIYKTEEVKTKDADGNDLITNKIVLDNNSQPIIDQSKLHAAVTGLQVTSDMLTDSQNTQNKYVKDYLRVSAFSEFVQAHINAGLENTLMSKLDALKTATPEDLAKLGFVADENLAQDIDKHKALASTIIKQNKILNESILFDNSKEDRARKAYLTNIAAKQAVTKYQMSFVENENTEAKNQFLNSENSSLSDGMVDQLNQLLYRIESNKEVIDYLKESGQDKVSPMSVYENLNKELEKTLDNLLKNNEETVSTLKKDDEGFYQYEKDDRNDFVTRQFLDGYLKTKGQMQNDIKTQGLLWAFYADNKDGKKNFTTSFNAELEMVNEKKKQKEEEERKLKEQEAEELKKKDEQEGIVDENQPTETEEDENIEDTPPTPPTMEDAPGLQQYLLDKYNSLRENNPEFKLDFNTWISSGAADFFVKEYNKKFGTDESLFNAQGGNLQDDTNEDKQKLIDSLSIVDTTRSTLLKAISAVRKVFDKLKGDETFVNKLLAKIEEVKDEFARISIRAVVTGKQDSIEADYISLSDAGVYVNNQEHVGYDKVNINKDEVETGFVLKGDKTLIQSMASDLGTVNDRIKVVASRKYVNDVQKQVTDSKIPNRSTITYETPNEIANKLKRGRSVIAVASKAQGFNTQIFSKNAQDTSNIYIAGVENYAIVHPDNTTEPVTFSEDQRDFVKKNMLVNGQEMTDNQFDRLQKIYNKVQDFNAEVELVLGENEEMDITPIFNQYFTVTKSGRSAQQGQSFESLIKDNPESLFRVMYQTPSGEILEKDVPLVTEKYGTSWVTDFVMNPGETLMYMDEQSGEVVPVTNRKQYFNDVHGINPEFTDNFKGGVYAWVAKEPSDSKGYKPYMLKKDKGTEPVAYFKKFANEFRDLKKVLQEGAETKEYKYKGQTFSTVNDLMKFFNMNVYGFYRAGQWNLNMSYNPKTKKFAFEFRPTDKQKRDSLNDTQKQALNLYFNDASVLSVNDSLEDAAVIDAYNTWVKSLISGLGKLGENLAKSEDPVQRELRAMLDSKAMFFYEMENDKKNYFLKLQDKTSGRNIPVEFLSYNASNQTGNVTVALNEEPVAPVKKKAAKPSGLVSLGTLNDSDVPGTQLTAVSTNVKADIEKRRQEELEKNNKLRVQDFKTKLAEKFNSLPETRAKLKQEVSNDNSLSEQDKELLTVAIDGIFDIPGSNPFIVDEINGYAPYNLKTFEEYIKYNFPNLSRKQITDVLSKHVEYFATEHKGALLATLEGPSGLPSNLAELNAAKINAKYDAELAALEKGTSPVFTAPDNKTSAKSTSGKKGRRIIKKLDDEAPFMLRDESEYQRYTDQSYNEEIQWLSKALKNSGITLRDLGTIIDKLSAKKQVLGYYKNRAIYVNSNLSAEGSIYHEAFHGLFRDIFTSDQRAFYLSKARGKMGLVTKDKIDEFRNDRNYFNKTDREIVDLMAEELLAEGFRKYKLDQKEPADTWFKKFVRLIERIINFFDRNKKAIDDLYADFDGGVYSEQVANPENSISKEGVFALAYGRPKLVETVDEDTGESGFGIISKIPLNMEVQNELVSKLTFRVANMKEGTFASKFALAVEELKSEYDIEALVANSDPALDQGIRNKYQNSFNEASFILGVPVRYVLDDALINDEDANEMFTEVADSQETQDFIKEIVRQKIESLGLEAGFSSDDLQVPQDEEDIEEGNKGGEFDKIHINPLEGLTREFRNLFNIIPYTYTDPTLGVTLNRTADGNMLFNAMIKVASDKPLDQILPSLDKAVRMMEEDGDPKYASLKAFADFIQRQFGIADLSDPTSKPTRNLFLYKQFIDTFFVTELPSYVIKSVTNPLGTTSEVFDASINQDVLQKKEAIKFYYEQAYRKMITPEQKAKFTADFKNLQEYINTSLFSYLKTDGINNRKSLNKVVNEVKDLMDNVNIVLPKNLIRQSLLGIYTLENESTFNANSKQNIADMETDQRLMKEGAYLQGDFFNTLAQIKPQNYSNVFVDTRDKNVNLGADYKRIDQLNKILKKASKYIIKYDINSSISVYQNAENKNIYRYTKYTPPVLLTQLVREKGVEALKDMYPVLSSWMSDNILFDGSLKNQVFLENLQMSSFGGIRQEIGDNTRNGVTFGSIDSKAFHLGSIVHFMNREKIVSKKKNDQGKTEDVEVITFKRSRTQEEATTTNFLVTGMYNRYVKDNNVNSRFVGDTIGFLRQEYNRIAREWKDRSNPDTLRYKDYNNNEQGRAYKFVNFVHFFEQQKTTDTNSALRQEMRDALLDAAKKGLAFEEALKSDVMMQLPSQIVQYMNETFETYKDALVQYGLLTRGKEKGTFDSPLIPKKIKEDFRDGTLEDFGYTDILDMLKDLHLNIEMNKRMVNQIYDGDIATGISNAQNYYKRNKSGVISGNSMKTGYFRTAVVSNIMSYIPTTVNPITGEVDFDLTAFSVDEEQPGTKSVDVADGQSYHTMNHRIRMMDSWGRVDTTVKALLQKAKYKKLTNSEIELLDERKVVLNTIKTATGGILEYYKLSEHLINRVDVSRIVVPQGMTQEEAESNLDELYTRIEMLEDLIVQDPNTPDSGSIEEQIEELYSEVHSYWEPKRGREKLHYMLNSMESSGIDQLFDPNASKKTTLVPIKLEAGEITNLKPSKSFTSGMFKFLQVETSGVTNRITLPTQARQLLTTYINKLDNDMVYRNKSLKDLAQEYSNTLGDITNSSTQMLDKALLDKTGNLNISQLFNTMYNGLKKQGADSNTLKYFEVRDGKPVHNPNLPAIKKIFTYYYFSLFNDSIFSQKVNGRKDILVSGYGYEVLYDTQDNNRVISQLEQDRNPEIFKDTDRFKTRHLGVSVEKVNGKNVYTVEVMIPEQLAKNESERELFLTKLTKFFSTRIPTEDRRSMIVAKVVDYLDPSYQNSIVVPQLVHILAGSDLDVDALYSHTFEHYLDYTDQAHVYGDYSKYATQSQGQFAEYIQYMSQHPLFKDLVQTELDNVINKPVFTTDFLKIATQLGISSTELTVDDIKQKRADIQANIEILEKAKNTLQAEHDMLFSAYVSASKNNRSKENAEWRNKRVEYLAAKDSLDAMFEDLRSTKEDLAKMNNTLKLAALVNVLKTKNMPVSQAEFTKYLGSNPTPVLPVLNNESLQQKIDILSNEKVFQDFYINERSTVEPFREIASSIGASVDAVVTQNSIYSVMGDVVANQLNSSNKDGIGIAASFNKFLAFSEKNSVSLDAPLFYDIDSSGKLNTRIDFTNSEAIRRTGQALGMFADAAKEPIPSVLNLNPDTSGVSNVIMGMTGNLQFALLINKIPFVENITDEYRNQNSAIQDAGSFMAPGLKAMIKGKLKEMISDIASDDRLTEIFEVDNKGEVIFGQFRPMYVKTVEPNPAAASMKREDITLSDLGLELYYEDGSSVVEDVAQAYLANTYANVLTLNSDILELGKLLNLIKQQKPEFNELDSVLSSYDYFTSGTSIFGDSIAKALKSSKEYTNLVKAAQKMSDYSRQILIERSPLFSSIRSILGSGLNNTFGNEKARQDITDQIGKFIIINKIKNNIKLEIEDLKGKKDEKSIDKLAMLEESAKYFTADFWLDNNSLLDDLDYLYTTNPGNPFVEFLKVNGRQGIDYLEATSRMKLDKDLTENIINGYESLQKSKDKRTLRLSRQMFYYLLAKDGLGYGAFTFIKYVNPDIPQMTAVSDSLTEFQKLLSDQQSFIQQKRQLIMDVENSGKKPEEKQALVDQIVKDIYQNYTKLFDKFFNNTSRAGQVDWINGIVNKIFTYAGNQKYIRQTYSIKTETKEAKEAVASVINSGVFSHISEVKSFTGRSFDYFKSAPNTFTIDFRPVKNSMNSDMQSTFISFYPSVNINTNELQSVSFKVLLSDGEGKLYKLNKIDDKPISEAIARNSMYSYGKIPNSGLTAEYIKLDIEGTNSLLNFGFTKQDGIKLYEKVRPADDINDLLNAGVDPSVLSQLSDNKTQQEAPSKFVGTTTAQQAPNEIGFRVIGESAQPTVATKPGVEISSNSKGLAAALTNPTELAKSKGNITQSYPIYYTWLNEQGEAQDNNFKDVEEAYQRLKDSSESKTKPSIDKSKNYKLMVDLLKSKLEQYPRLVNEITKQGGSAWILASTHQPTKQNTVWETGGQNWFINALNEAYLFTQQPTAVPNEITLKEIDDIYNQKSVKKITLQEFRKEAQDYIKVMSTAGMSKSAILEQLKCL